ncbi:MAG: HAD family hydrolase [Syntrophus sp. (in: bacteria)]|nr:HAD family hydrolase [Syntrophus sp. (in: bacteria)]
MKNRTLAGHAEAILTRKHWVFDLDGTLTLPVHDFSVIRQALGVPQGIDILGYLASLPDPEAQPLHDKLNAIETELLEQIEPAPGTVQLIEALQRRGSRMGVLTRNTRDIAIRTLDSLGVGGYFPEECILGRGDAPPKPDPEGLFRFCVRWRTVPAEMVMVGDYVFDLQTGRNAGAATIHIDRTRSFLWPELTDIGVSTPEELLQILPA